MSDTPRTEVAVARMQFIEAPHDLDGKFADFARQLERELAEAQSKLAEISITHGKWMADALQAGAELAEAKRDSATLIEDCARAFDKVNPAIWVKARLAEQQNEIDSLKAQLAEAKKDAARLDWVMSKIITTGARGLNASLQRDDMERAILDRAAIDAAMEAGNE